MMTRNVSKNLLSYHLNTLPEPARAEVEELLLDSPAAVIEYLAIKREREVSSAPAPIVPSRVHARLRAAIAADYAATRPRFRRAAPWIAVAAAAVIAGLIFYGQGPGRGLVGQKGAPPQTIQKAQNPASSSTGIAVDGADLRADML